VGICERYKWRNMTCFLPRLVPIILRKQVTRYHNDGVSKIYVQNVLCLNFVPLKITTHQCYTFLQITVRNMKTVWLSFEQRDRRMQAKKYSKILCFCTTTENTTFEGIYIYTYNGMDVELIPWSIWLTSMWLRR